MADKPVIDMLAAPITLAKSPSVIVADTLPKSLAKTFASALTSGLFVSTTAFADTPEK